MKATGIIRRIDELGRIVIPKEIRRTLHFREGEKLEIFTDSDGEVILKKYSSVSGLGNFAENYAETLAKTSGHGTCITDRDSIIAVSGLPKKELLEKPVSQELDSIMNGKITVTNQSGKSVSVTDENEKYSAGVVVPIVSEGDAVGSVALITDKKTSETDVKLAQSAAVFLGRYTEC